MLRSILFSLLVVSQFACGPTWQAATHKQRTALVFADLAKCSESTAKEGMNTLTGWLANPPTTSTGQPDWRTLGNRAELLAPSAFSALACAGWSLATRAMASAPGEEPDPGYRFLIRSQACDLSTCRTIELKAARLMDQLWSRSLVRVPPSGGK